MKVLLVDPPNRALDGTGNPVHVHPLGLACLVAVLRPQHDVSQLVADVRAFAEPEDVWPAIAETLRAVSPQVVGITTMTATLPSARRLARLVRETLGPDVWIVGGGVHATFQPESVLDGLGADVVVIGEGEQTFAELLATLERTNGEPGDALRAIEGLMGRSVDGHLWYGPSRAPIADLDTLPLPERRGVLWSEHLQPGFYQSIITVRGCPYACVYCSVPASSQRRTRYRSAVRVAEELATLRSDWNIPFVFYHDSVFTLNRKRTLELMRLTVERDLVVPYTCQTRTDRVDPELLDAMKAGGCHQIFFGIESGHPESLKRIGKAVPLPEIRSAVAAVKARGIRCAGFFMVGFPWETEDHVRTTTDFALDLDLDAVSLFSATPLPGTALWDGHSGNLPEAIDFRAPQVNLTALSPGAYADLFLSSREQFEAYNRAQSERIATHWPRG